MNRAAARAIKKCRGFGHLVRIIRDLRAYNPSGLSHVAGRTGCNVRRAIGAARIRELGK